MARRNIKLHAIFLGVVLIGFLSAFSYAQAPVPFVSLPLVPDATAPGGGDFILTVNGTGFVSNSVVKWNGTALATQFVNGSQLTATVPAADIATASTAWVTVLNPAPGGGTSSVAFFTVTAISGESPEFAPAATLTVGPLRSLATGDFNGDGKLDLVVPNSIYDGAVSLLLGDGAGNFASASYPVGGRYPSAVAVGDFNGDDKLDLAVACVWNLPNSVFILLGDGAGAFTAVSSTVVGDAPEAIAVGDFNGDGKLDLAVVNEGGNSLSILLGDGTGNFTLASSPATGSTPVSVAVGDFNGDGKLDLAVVNFYPFGGGDTVSILLGDGTGNFTLASSPATGTDPTSVAVGDFNGDGKLDLAVANVFASTLSILLGDGTGNFTLASSPAAGDPISLAVGDFTGDGKLDLAVTHNDNWVSVQSGDGTGNFTMGPPFGVGSDPVKIVVGDFNGDGYLDLATANFNDSTVSILLGVRPFSVVQLSPTNLTFATQLIGTRSDPQPVTLTNIGTAPLKIIRIQANHDFSQTNDCPKKLLFNGQCTIKVDFVPHGRGAKNGTLTITDNAPTSPQTVPLTGVATAVTLLPPNLNFGGQKVGGTSPPQAATFTNYGKDPVLIHRIRIAGANSRSFAQTNNCGTSVPAGGSCTINVTFTPQYKGQKTATLEVHDNGGASPQTVALSGTGTK